jgi:serine/threonine-protein kinase
MSTDPTRLAATTGMEMPRPERQRDLTGRTLGDFQLLRLLGEGGMGQVYLAEQISLKRRVALKLLRAELSGNEVSRRRFEGEAKAVAQLTHANIVQVYQVGEHEGLLYMALEYVDGRNLREHLSHRGPPEPSAAISIMRQAASALQRAAEFGIVHRDIKPENILLTRKGEVKVADFGLSRIISDAQPANNLTQTGTTMGTPLYMSPEQVEGKPLDHRTDIYSLGVTCYHMLAGQPPFEGETAFAVAIQHVQSEPVALSDLRPDLPPELCAIVAKMMAKRPEERYQTAREILQDVKRLTQILKGKAAPEGQLLAVAAPPTPGSAPASATGSLVMFQAGWSRRRKLVVAVAASLLLAVGVGAGLGYAFRGTDTDNQVIPALPPSALAQIAKESLQDQEQSLRTLVNRTKKPSDPESTRHGAQYRVDLALFLLKEQKNDADALNRAHKTFEEWLASPVEQYQQVGCAGAAIAFAWQDKPKESNAQLLRLFELLKVAEKGPRALFATLPGDLEFRVMLSRAMQRNYENLVLSGEERNLPPLLEQLRRLRPGPGTLPPLDRPKVPAKNGASSPSG